MNGDTHFTIREISERTGLHRNTIYRYVKRGKLKGERVMRGGGETWLVSEHELYNSGIPKLNTLLGPQNVEARATQNEVAPFAVPDKYLAEITRVNRELTAANTELGILRSQIPALQAAQGERDSLREETERLQAERIALDKRLEVTTAAMKQARDNATWRYRRRLKKIGQIK